MQSGSSGFKVQGLASVGLALVGVLLASSPVAAQSDRQTYRGAESSEAVVPFVFEGPLTDLPVVLGWRPGDPIKEIPRRHYFRPGEKPDIATPAPRLDPLLATQEQILKLPAVDGFTTPIVNRDGQDFSGANPPDTVGAVGIDHYIQMVNGSSGGVFTIYDKSDGTVAAGPIALDSMSPGGSCGSGYGDGVVLYDHLADRWLLTEFNTQANSVCVYVSQESDPTTTSWYAYEFATITFPDYPKYGVWPDAYYLSTNESTSAVYALDRASMLTGAPASAQRFGIGKMPGFGFQAMTPGDLDGSILPPAGSPGFFMRHRDTEAHGPTGLPDTDLLEIWEFSVDWIEPADSTLTGPTNIVVTDFDSELCGFFSFSCIPQPDSSVRLDPLREVIMFRLQYRNFGSFETLVGNLVTDTDGADHAGVRWFELRDGGTGWDLYQEGTLAPDEHHRWMGSIAMDAIGNIGLGYNVSSVDVPPGLRYTGRLTSDPLGTMGQPETELVAGATANGSNRYGDYAAISVDPVDDCTFWFTGQYNRASAWSTRIGSFKFDNCSSDPDFTINAKPQEQQVCSPDDAVFVVDVGSVQGFGGDVALDLAGEPTGSTVGFNPNPVSAGESSVLTLGGMAAVVPGIYDLEISGIATPGTRMGSAKLLVFDSEPAPPTLLEPADGADDQAVSLTFSWSEVGVTYSIEIATDPAFTDIVDSAVGLTETTYQPPLALDSASIYYWRVWAENACGVGSTSAVWSFETLKVPGDCIGDYTPATEFYDDLESGALGWKSGGTENTWALSSDRTSSGVSAWHAMDLDLISDQYLISPPVDLPTGRAPLELAFANWQGIESDGDGCYDGAVVEISNNDGLTWTRLETELVNDPYHGEVAADYGNPIAGENAWCGDPQDWLESIVDLNAWAGDTVKLRFRLATDTSIGAEGWYIDDVEVTSCREVLFRDGFESGSTEGWSFTFWP